MIQKSCTKQFNLSVPFPIRKTYDIYQVKFVGRYKRIFYRKPFLHVLGLLKGVFVVLLF